MTEIGEIFGSGICFGEIIITANFSTMALGLVGVRPLDFGGGLNGEFFINLPYAGLANVIFVLINILNIFNVVLMDCGPP